MNCATARQFVHAELDGELSAEQQAALAEHVQNCSDCGAMRSQLLAIRSAMRRLAAATEPNSIPLQPISFARSRRVFRLAVPAWTWAAAAVMVLCFAGWLAKDIMRRSPGGPAPLAIDHNPPVENPVALANLPQPAPRETPNVTIQTPPDMIAVPCSSRNPRVTVFWLYTVTTTVQNSEPTDRNADRPM